MGMGMGMGVVPKGTAVPSDCFIPTLTCLPTCWTWAVEMGVGPSDTCTPLYKVADEVCIPDSMKWGSMTVSTSRQMVYVTTRPSRYIHALPLGRPVAPTSLLPLQLETHPVDRAAVAQHRVYDVAPAAVETTTRGALSVNAASTHLVFVDRHTYAVCRLDLDTGVVVRIAKLANPVYAIDTAHGLVVTVDVYGDVKVFSETTGEVWSHWDIAMCFVRSVAMCMYLDNVVVAILVICKPVGTRIKLFRLDGRAIGTIPMHETAHRIVAEVACEGIMYSSRMPLQRTKLSCTDRFTGVPVLADDWPQTALRDAGSCAGGGIWVTPQPPEGVENQTRVLVLRDARLRADWLVACVIMARGPLVANAWLHSSSPAERSVPVL
jgi:hypothetical protein